VIDLCSSVLLPFFRCSFVVLSLFFRCSSVVLPFFVLRPGAATVRQRALQLLNERVVEDAQFFDGAEINLFLELVDELSLKAFPTSQAGVLVPGVQQAYLYR
jgi:hypothetical protein